MTDLPDVRRRAWETRRKKYGPKGHATSYQTGMSQGPRGYRLSRLVAYVLESGILSEGQAAAVIGTGRMAVRMLRDDGLESLEADPIDGAWGREAMNRMKAPGIVLP